MILVKKLRAWAYECDRTNSGCQVKSLLLEAARTIEYLLREHETVKHGRWEDTHEIKSFKRTNIPVVQCSECECYFCDIINNHHYMYHYCPNCGAKMDLECG